MPKLKLRAVALNTKALTMASFGGFIDPPPAKEQLSWLELVQDQAHTTREALLILRQPPLVCGAALGTRLLSATRPWWQQ